MTSPGIWCGIRHDGYTEMHLFPLDSEKTACKRRTRGKDSFSYIMRDAPSGPTGCVCRECWKIYSDNILGSSKIEEGEPA